MIDIERKSKETRFCLHYYVTESRAGPSYIGNVVSQILLCKQIRPDFNEEELCSIRKDSEEISRLIAELQEFMPQSEADTGTITSISSFMLRSRYLRNRMFFRKYISVTVFNSFAVNPYTGSIKISIVLVRICIAVYVTWSDILNNKI